MGFTLEVGLAMALHTLFRGSGPSRLGIDALCEQLDPELPAVKRLRKQTGRTRAWVPRLNPGPDLCLLTADNRHSIADLLAVLEIKAGAGVNYPLVATAARIDANGTPIPGAEVVRAKVAEDVAERGYAKLSQLDLYRAWPWWNEQRHHVRARRGKEVLWLYFDLESPNQAASHLGDKLESMRSHSAAHWTWIDGVEFGRALARGRDRAREAGELSHSDSDAVAVVLWHLGFSSRVEGPNPLLWADLERKNAEEDSGGSSRV